MFYVNSFSCGSAVCALGDFSTTRREWIGREIEMANIGIQQRKKSYKVSNLICDDCEQLAEIKLRRIKLQRVESL